MTDLDLVMQKLSIIEEGQKSQGNDIKELSKGFTVLAVQSEQITALQKQTMSLWDKYDAITGPKSILEKVREHQKGCPKGEMHRTFNWMWAAIGVHSVVLLALISGVITIATKVAK